MSIDIEMLKSVLGSLILEFGEFDEVTGVMKKEQISAIDEAVILANEFGLFAKDTERPEPAIEWDGESWPPAGHMVQVEDFEHGWIDAEVMGFDKAEMAIVCKTDFGYAGYRTYRRIRTKAERDRDELQALLENWGHSSVMIRKTVDAILAAGWQKPD